MIYSLPATGAEFTVMIVPLLTVLLGFGFLVFPKNLLRFMGLEAVSAFPEAIGEGRSSFAGFMLAIGIACLLLQDPIALQPSLNFVLALAWSIAAVGRLVQMAVDQGWRKRIQVRFLLAAVFAGLAWSATEMPVFRCLNPFEGNCMDFSSGSGLFLYLLALLTLLLGVVALFTPEYALAIMRLQSRIKTPFAVGEPRGTLAGFYIATGGTYLAMPQPVDFVAIVLGAGWLFTGVGRLLSIIVDRGWSRFNFLACVFELGVGGGALALIFRLI